MREFAELGRGLFDVAIGVVTIPVLVCFVVFGIVFNLLKSFPMTVAFVSVFYLAVIFSL